ncbi:hypothetical protein Taro_003803, partial [Colocasia esculenta]|nr:hypothetical protein [Colocasia esculenta]
LEGTSGCGALLDGKEDLAQCEAPEGVGLRYLFPRRSKATYPTARGGDGRNGRIRSPSPSASSSSSGAAAATLPIVHGSGGMGLYQGGVWRIRVELPDAYPYNYLKVFYGFITSRCASVCLDVINWTWSPMFDLLNVFEVFLPQLLLYPNPWDPLNGEAAALMMRDRPSYEQKVKGGMLLKKNHLDVALPIFSLHIFKFLNAAEMDGCFSLRLVRNGSIGPTLGSPSLGISTGTSGALELIQFYSIIESAFCKRNALLLEEKKSQLKVHRARIVELASFSSQPHSRHFQRGNNAQGLDGFSGFFVLLVAGADVVKVVQGFYEGFPLPQGTATIFPHCFDS